VSLRISRIGALGLLAFVAISAAMFLLLSARIGGPGFNPAPAYTLRATFADAEGLSQGSDVLVHGFKVGEVKSASTRGAVTDVVVALDSADLPLHADASLSVGEKTPLGEAFGDLRLGRTGPRPPSGARVKARSSVEIDEALSLLDPAGRRSLVGVTKTLGEGASSPATALRVRATLDGLTGTVHSLHSLTSTLHGQERDIATAVGSSRVVLGELGRHDAAIRSIVRDGRVALGAVAAERGSLRATMRALPPLLSDARVTLSEAHPLLGEALPVAAALRRAAPPLTAALKELPPVLRSARVLVARGPRLERDARPTLAAARAVLPVAEPAVRLLGPALANAVPMMRFLAPRANTTAAWFTNTADLGSNGDAKGKWARFFLFTDQATASGVPAGAPAGNTYTKPDDAAHNDPYHPGDFPRLMPYGPALTGGSARRPARVGATAPGGPPGGVARQP
jgi:phospholipid/cholesterol/gamma-HCH transport system substrate-binding protein